MVEGIWISFISRDTFAFDETVIAIWLLLIIQHLSFYEILLHKI